MGEFIAGLAHATVVLSLAVGGILALRPFVRRHLGAKPAYHLWTLAPVSLLALALPARTAPSALSAPPASPPQSATSIAPLTPIEVEPAPPAGDPISPVPMPLDLSIEAGAVMTTPLLGVWLTGLAISLCVFAVQHWRACQAYAPMAPVDGLGVFRAASACVGPAVVGVWRPRVVIPADFETRFDPTEQALVLSHERAHLRQGDTRVNMAVCLLVSAFWFNPLIHFAARCFRQDQEMARDADALAAAPGREAAYSRALLSAQAGSSRFMPSGCAWTPRHPLVERVAMLTRARPSRFRLRLGRGVLAVLAAAAAAGAWAAQPLQRQPLIGETALFSLAGAYDAPRHVSQSRLELRHPGRINLVFEARRDIEIRPVQGLEVAMETAGAQLILGPRSDTPCTPAAAAAGPADLIVRVPEEIELTVSGASQARVAGAARGRIQAEDCAHLVFADFAAPARLSGADQSSLTIERLGARAEFVLSDASALQIEEAAAALTLDQIGASRSTIGRLHRPITATVAGASTLSLNTIETSRADLLVVGASQLTVADGAVDLLDLKVLGASSAQIGAVAESAQIGAAGGVTIALDRVADWTVTSWPDEDGQLRINGRLQPP